MIAAYEIKEKEAVIWRCYDYGTEAEIPEYIGDCPVTELAPYVFSAHMDEKILEEKFRRGELGLWETEKNGYIPNNVSDPFWDTLPPVLKGTGLTAVSLPAGLRRIGAYAFYNCSRLQELRFCGTLSDLGAGLFTGCHSIRKLYLALDAAQASCLREVLIEVPEKLTVFMTGSIEARLVFPEFFEESVENTPARILVTQIHGSGMNYRNCFYNRKFDFRAYDACFYQAKAQEDFDTVQEMVLARLMYPEQLSAEGRADYEAWLLEHVEQAVKKIVLERDMETLEYLTAHILTGHVLEEQAEAAVLRKAASQAASCGFLEAVPFLMEILGKRRTAGQGAAPGKENRFEL